MENKNKGGRPEKYDWQQIKQDYELGLSYAEIAKKRRCSREGIYRRVREQGWVVNSQQSNALNNFKKNVNNIVTLSEQNPSIMDYAIDYLENLDAEIKNKVTNLNLNILDKAGEMLPSVKDTQDLNNLASVSKKIADIHGITKTGSLVTINNNQNNFKNTINNKELKLNVNIISKQENEAELIEAEIKKD